jgi:hypothetical protein
MSTVTYTDVMNAKSEAASLRSMIRTELKTKRAEIRVLKTQLIESKAEDRTALQTRMMADGGKRIGAYVIKTSGKRFTMVPDSPALPITKGEASFLSAILSSLKVG